MGDPCRAERASPCPSYLLDELKFPQNSASKLRGGLGSGSAPERDDKVQRNATGWERDGVGLQT